jgi:hypothetical protein
MRANDRQGIGDPPRKGFDLSAHGISIVDA